MPQPHTKKSDSKVSQAVVAQIQFYQLLVATQDRGDVEAALMGKATPPQPSCQVQKQKESEHRLLLSSLSSSLCLFSAPNRGTCGLMSQRENLNQSHVKCHPIRPPAHSLRLTVKLAHRLTISQPETTTVERISELSL